MKRNERFEQIIFAYVAALGGRWPERASPSILQAIRADVCQNP
jgi:hypothetical protein